MLQTKLDAFVMPSYGIKYDNPWILTGWNATMIVLFACSFILYIHELLIGVPKYRYLRL